MPQVVVERLALHELLEIPVRQLSLGQRMSCEPGFTHACTGHTFPG